MQQNTHVSRIAVRIATYSEPRGNVPISIANSNLTFVIEQAKFVRRMGRQGRQTTTKTTIKQKNRAAGVNSATGLSKPTSFIRL